MNAAVPQQLMKPESGGGLLLLRRSTPPRGVIRSIFGARPECAQALQPMVGEWGLGEGLPRSGGGSKERVSDDRFDHRASPPASGHGPQKGGADKALGRSRGGLTTKIHLLADDLGLPVDFVVTGGQVNDCTQAIDLLGERKAEWVLADKGYDSQAILNHIEAMGAVAVVPSKSNRRQQRTHDKELYRKRNRIERCFSRLKHFRRFATRYEKLKQNFQSLVALACSWMHLKLYVDTA
jgi:transposase